MSHSVTTGYAPVNGVEMYWESRGTGGPPLIVTHGGFGRTTMFGPLLDELAEHRQVVAIELQGHGHTRDIDRPFGFESFGDDIAALARQLDLGQVDLLGCSLGGGATLRATIQHPDLVRRMVLISAPGRSAGWFPEVRDGMAQLGRAGFEQMKMSPKYTEWAEVAPDPDAFPTLMDKTGDLLRGEYDWTEEIKQITAPTLLVFADADSISVSHLAEFFALLGGGLRDGNFDGSAATPMRLAVLPNTTHYNVFVHPSLGRMVEQFLS
ncbi:MAG TPA: alpha/beta hydrolase [Pseudonocardiaceae bacterium]|jgi:pimeloyl-ACP methyl ester carboxylesterase|nr:alpha/beta hydrolase [Pseudonocardiaceae bacterium]